MGGLGDEIVYKAAARECFEPYEAILALMTNQANIAITMLHHVHV